jgi:hypothetical protein
VKLALLFIVGILAGGAATVVALATVVARTITKRYGFGR